MEVLMSQPQTTQRLHLEMPEGEGELPRMELPWTPAGRIHLLAEQLAFELAWSYPREGMSYERLSRVLLGWIDRYLDRLQD